MRKVLAAIAGGCLLWVVPAVAPPASAHDAHDGWFKWREPEESSDVAGEKVQLRAKVQFEEGVERWILEILPPDGYGTMASWGTVCETPEKQQQKDEKPKTVEIACEWNSTTYPDGEPSRNHAYRARVTAWSKPAEEQGSGEGGESGNSEGGSQGEGEGGGDQGGSGGAEGGGAEGGGAEGGGAEGGGSESGGSESGGSEGGGETTTSSSTTTTTSEPAAEDTAHEGEVRTLVVANPPAPPKDVTLDYEKETSEVTVSWKENPEPDIAHYLVEERVKDGDWSLVAKTTATKWTGELEKKGTYRYRVAAVRYVGSKQRTIQGPSREPQSGKRKIEADPKKARADAERREDESAAGKRKEQEDEKDKRKSRDEQAQAEGATTTTAPPGSVIVTFDGSGDPNSAPTAGAGEGAGPTGLSAIEPGTPGSVQTRYADPAPLPAPVSPDQAYDPGFSLALPYPKEVRLDIGPPPEPQPRLLGTVVLFDSNEDQRRALVGVLAGGLVVFIVSMQAAYLNRRPRPIDLPTTTDWD